MKLPEGNGQLTLVALFGDKKQKYQEFWTLLEKIQCYIEKCFGKENFNRYDERRVHGTIVGLEGYRHGENIWNRNIYKMSGMHCPMNVNGLLDCLLVKNPLLPMSVKIGGFKKDVAYPISSQGYAPYLRSFSFQGDLAVVMGWPVNNRLYTPDLDRLRRSFNEFNVIHKYHNSAKAYDNDFFIVLGHIRRDLSNNLVNECQTQVREILARSDVTPIQITTDQLSVVAYSEGDTRLERAVAASLKEAEAHIDELKGFYPEFTDTSI